MVTGVRLVDKLANKRAPHVRIEAGSTSPLKCFKIRLGIGVLRFSAGISFHFLSFSFIFFPCEVWFSNMSDTERVDQLQRSLEKRLGMFSTPRISARGAC